MRKTTGRPRCATTRNVAKDLELTSRLGLTIPCIFVRMLLKKDMGVSSDIAMHVLLQSWERAVAVLSDQDGRSSRINRIYT